MKYGAKKYSTSSFSWLLKKLLYNSVYLGIMTIKLNAENKLITTEKPLYTDSSVVINFTLTILNSFSRIKLNVVAVTAKVYKFTTSRLLSREGKRRGVFSAPFRLRNSRRVC